eukprot:5249274-Pleurochrysis_carterae.AAC.1
MTPARSGLIERRSRRRVDMHRKRIERHARPARPVHMAGVQLRRACVARSGGGPDRARGRGGGEGGGDVQGGRRLGRRRDAGLADERGAAARRTSARTRRGNEQGKGAGIGVGRSAGRGAAAAPVCGGAGSVPSLCSIASAAARRRLGPLP